MTKMSGGNMPCGLAMTGRPEYVAMAYKLHRKVCETCKAEMPDKPPKVSDGYVTITDGAKPGGARRQRRKYGVVPERVVERPQDMIKVYGDMHQADLARAREGGDEIVPIVNWGFIEYGAA
jgi:hypothetical protein